jgi:hypothetical protein
LGVVAGGGGGLALQSSLHEQSAPQTNCRPFRDEPARRGDRRGTTTTTICTVMVLIQKPIRPGQGP